jgi:hypothetical protein
MSAQLDLPELLDVPIIEVSELKTETPSKYHDLECCEWTRGIDTLLFRYKQDRDQITNLILEEPEELINTIWKSESPLAIDNECRCQMGKGEIRSPFACAQCKSLRRIIDFRLGGTERGFQIECGDSAGTNLIVASSEINAPFLALDMDAARRARFYVQQYHNLTICGTPDISDLYCITGDSFTIRTLIVWMIRRIFDEKNLPHCPLVHTAFICRGIGYSLYDLPSIGSISDLHKIADYHEINPRDVGLKSQHFAYARLKSSIARTIIVQLLVILLELMEVNFSHGTPSMHGLVFTKDPVSYAYNGVHVEGPITVQISDLWNASATFNGIHYFPKNVKSSMYLEKNMFVPEIASKKVSMAHCHDVGAVVEDDKDQCYEPIQQPIVCPATMTTCPDDVTYSVCKPQNVTVYKLTNTTLDIYNAMRHIGFPLYVGSFDFYCFMVSLMCDKSFFDAVKNDDRLYRLWSMMWLIEDLPVIERKIEQAHQIDQISVMETGGLPNRRTASNIAIEIIRGAWLRCDVVKFIWSLVKQGW